MRDKVSIVGTNARSRDKAPWDSPDYDFWVFNEAGNQPWVKGRIDALFQLHAEPVYRNTANKTDKKHWEWLQQDHSYPIYMQSEDPMVPASKRYPLTEISDLFLSGFVWEDGERIEFFTNTIAYSIAMTLYLGNYREIHIFGVEQESNTEYEYQRSCTAFWTGLAVGRGVKVVQHCGEGIYRAPLYGYTMDPQIKPDEFMKGVDELETAIKTDAEMIAQSLTKANEMLKIGDDQFPQQWNTTLETAKKASIKRGILKEKRRYYEKVLGMINSTGATSIMRQQFEINAGIAKQHMDQAISLLNFESGRSWILLQNFVSTKSGSSLVQFKQFAEKQLEYARVAGEMEGAWIANNNYQRQMDERIRAAGGEKALAALGGE